MARDRIVVYTAIANHYDELRAPETDATGCDYVCFADDRYLRTDGWTVRPFDEIFEDPTRTAKKPKIVPHRFFPDHDVSVWVDGNLSIRGDLRELVQRHLRDHPMALFRHPDGRGSVFEEAEACVRLGKDAKEVIDAQMDRYRSLGYRGERGLSACSVLIRRHHDPGVSRAMDAWWNEIRQHSRRDQLSFPFISWRHDLDHAVIDDNFRENPWVLWRKHDAKERLQRLEKRTRDSDAIIVSFPKSGRTWIRYFLAKYLEIARGFPFGLDFPRREGCPSIVFTHNFFDLNQNRNAPPRLLFPDCLLEKRLVVLVRDPRDVLVSYYHQKKDREGLPLDGLGDFANSPVFGIERQADFVLRLLELHDRHRGDKLLVSYEELHRSPEPVLRRLVEFLMGRPVHEDALRGAIQESSFERMHRFEQEISRSGSTETVFHRLGDPNWNGNRDALKVRRGKVGGYRDEMGPVLRWRVGRKPQTRALLRRLAEASR